MEGEKKRGRPRSPARKSVEKAGELVRLTNAVSTRGRLNFMYMIGALQAFRELPESTQVEMFGCPLSEIISSRDPRLPRGFRTAGNEIGRLLATFDLQERAELLSYITDWALGGMPWREVGRHCRNIRIGERTGEGRSLAMELVRVVVDFQERFPATPLSVIDEAVTRLPGLIALMVRAPMESEPQEEG